MIGRDAATEETSGRLAFAAARLEAAAEVLGSPAILDALAAGARQAALVASAEWLCAEDACLLAGRCSRQMLKVAVADGLVQRSVIGDRPVYERASLIAAIGSGRWTGQKRKAESGKRKF